MFLNLNQWISMTRNKSTGLLRTSCLSHIIVSWGFTCHHVTNFIKLLQVIEKLILRILKVSKVVSLSWTAGKVNKCMMSKTKSQTVIMSVELSVSLLKQKYPELITVTSWEHRTSVVEARDVIINSDYYPLPILADSNLIDSHSIVFLCEEESLNQLRSLCKTRRSWKNPAICKSSLLYVIRVNSPFKQLRGAFHEISRSSPMDHILEWVFII